jgi:glutamate formiminotransferase
MITKLGDKKWRIDFQPSNQAPRIGPTIVGPRALADEVLLELRKRSIREHSTSSLVPALISRCEGVHSVGG